ncbi:stress-response A/B barrel domain-containing protein UP3-like protein [Tanacetum coccineum]
MMLKDAVELFQLVRANKGGILALDVGRKYIGVALTNKDNSEAEPLRQISRPKKGEEDCVTKLARALKKMVRIDINKKESRRVFSSLGFGFSFSISLHQKCTAAIRQLAYGNTPDAFDEYLQMNAHGFQECLKALIVCTGSGKIVQYHGRDNTPVKINVLDNSPLFDDLLDDKAPVAPFVEFDLTPEKTESFLEIENLEEFGNNFDGELTLSSLDVLQGFSFFLQMGFTLILATLDGLDVGLLGDVIGEDDCDDDG